jgi:hypothetical protein
MSDEISLAEIVVTGKDIGGYRLQCDRLAVTPGGVLSVAQVVAPAAVVKGLAGVLHNNGQVAEVRLASGELTSEDYPSGRYFAAFTRDGNGYQRVAFVKLGYGLAHALFVAKTPGLLTDLSEPALWRELSGPRYTTPLLRAWVPYLRKRLREEGLLLPCLGHRCTAGVLGATDGDLDDLVSKGIKQGVLRLEEMAA